MHSQYSIAACDVIILLQGNDLPEAVTLGGAYDRDGSPVVFGSHQLMWQWDVGYSYISGVGYSC